MQIDPLSAILATFGTRSRLSGEIIAGGDWSVRFEPPLAIKFGAVLRGHCWHEVEGIGGPVRLTEGDVFVVNGRSPLRLSSDPGIVPRAAADEFGQGRRDAAMLGTGDDFHLLGAHVEIDRVGADLLADVLPPFTCLPARSAGAEKLAWLLGRLVEETVRSGPGSLAIAESLAHLLFVQTLRDHIETEAVCAGWLRAAGDPRIGPAISLIHAEPARNWQLKDLARASGMSRSSFAKRFKSSAGMAPLAYLTFWRMRLAARELGAGGNKLAALADALGYSSASAFSSAFKRAYGMSPARYRNQAAMTCGQEG